ncbi:ArsR/SmtB family transcription factor [Micromonospora sp. NPDC093277]|uniref:ArsR/SmtB family transcription factor n=1 Tax=Micromonospora sp. NPDC093277 TaxID=3364291 RepID=UPI00380415A8
MGNDESSAPRAVRLSHQQVRVLAHPLRTRLLGALRVRGPATATKLAEMLDTNTGATSYHLRQLAEVGLVAEDPDLGTGRQRFWRAEHDLTNWEPTDFDDDPDARAAVEWIEDNQVRQLVENAEHWFAVRHQWSPAWRDAFGMSDNVVTITPARLKALADELWQILERYRTEADPDEPGAEQVEIFLTALPLLAGRRPATPPTAEEER